MGQPEAWRGSLFSEASSAFLRGVSRKMGVENRAAGDTLAGGIQHEESDAAKRHGYQDGQSASPSIVDSL